MFWFAFLVLLAPFGVECAELKGGFRLIKYEDYERLKIATGWLDCQRIVFFIQRRRVEFFKEARNINWNTTLTIRGDGGFLKADNFTVETKAATKTIIYDDEFKSCKSYKVKWLAKEITKANGVPQLVIQGEQVVKMPCKCKQSVIEMEPFKLQTLNGAKYTFPSQSESSTRDYVFLRECNIIKTRISINGSVTSTGSTAKLNSVQYAFPNLVHAPHVLTMNPQGKTVFNDREGVNAHDDHYAGAEWFDGSGKLLVVFTNIEVRVLWDYKEKRITIATGEEFDACGLLTYVNGKASDNVQQLPKEFVKEWINSED
ncbi:uncharacterized protein LOC144363722 [Saccoglossus kowalevskii]